MEYTDGVKRPAANIAVAIMTVATLAHAFAVVARAVAASRAPWGNLYEFMTSGALVISIVYLLFLIRKDLRFVGTFVSVPDTRNDRADRQVNLRKPLYDAAPIKA